MIEKKRKKRNDNYVIGLLSGRIGNVTVNTLDGPKLVQVFKPFKFNPNPTLHEIRKNRGEKFTEDQTMIYEGLRHRRIFINYDEFAKNDEEKLALKEAKSKHKSTLIKLGFNPKFRLNISEPQILR